MRRLRGIHIFTNDASAKRDGLTALPYVLSLATALVALTCFISACTRYSRAPAAVASEMAADTIMVNGKIVTVDQNFSIAEAVAVKGDKIMADGIPPLKTAWMYQPYVGGGVGGLVVKGNNDKEKEAELRAIIRILHKNRYQIAIHGPGERTVDVCYDEFMKCMAADPWDARHYNVHCDFARPETLKKIGEFNKRTGNELSINVQSAVKWTIADHMPQIVGPERAAYMWPLRSMLDAGIRVTDSSDAPVTDPNFLYGIEAAVLRESKATKTPIGPEQAITVKEAIVNYTIHGAWQTHQENIKGSIEAGKYADFCVLDKDLLTIEPHEISRARVLATIVGGRIVYNARSDYLHAP